MPLDAFVEESGLEAVRFIFILSIDVVGFKLNRTFHICLE
jgi:hypothetical protein